MPAKKLFTRAQIENSMQKSTKANYLRCKQCGNAHYNEDGKREDYENIAKSGLCLWCKHPNYDYCCEDCDNGNG